jgi:hypothetical protein
MGTPNPDDLNALIDQATTTVSKAAERRRRAKSALNLTPVLGVVLAALIAFALWSIYSRLAPPGAATIERDLDAVVEQARVAIEAARKENGQLPDALPNASLASVVQYQHGSQDYQLSATIMGIRVTLAPGGKKTVEKE